MENFTLIIIIFAVYSIVGSVLNQRKSRRVSRGPDGSWSPQTGVPQPIKKLLEPWLSQTNGPWSGKLPSDKESELGGAEGKEGVWGDEGRQGNEVTSLSERRAADVLKVLSREASGAVGTPGVKESTEKGYGNGISNAERSYDDKDLSTVTVLNVPTSMFNVTTFSENDLVQGVVWAEVLSRPRALRPFRSTQINSHSHLGRR
ncbi:MAG: hypothetical protein ACYCVD_09305 [Desulfitobacteriaceae bacterium]